MSRSETLESSLAGVRTALHLVGAGPSSCRRGSRFSSPHAKNHHDSGSIGRLRSHARGAHPKTSNRRWCRPSSPAVPRRGFDEVFRFNTMRTCTTYRSTLCTRCPLPVHAGVFLLKGTISPGEVAGSGRKFFSCTCICTCKRSRVTVDSWCTAVRSGPPSS